MINKKYIYNENNNHNINVIIEPRSDFMIYKILDHNYLKIYNSQNIHYISINKCINYNYLNDTKNISFDLYRVKFNIILNDNNNININDNINDNDTNYTIIKKKSLFIPSEFIDVSIPLFNDQNLQHLRTEIYNNNNYYKIFNFIETKDYMYNILSYSDYGNYYDLLNTLFIQTNPAWIDQKYEKRLIRLFIFYFKNIYNNNIVNSNNRNKINSNTPNYIKSINFNNNSNYTVVTNNICTKYYNNFRSELIYYDKYEIKLLCNLIELIKQINNPIIIQEYIINNLKQFNLLPSYFINNINNSRIINRNIFKLELLLYNNFKNNFINELIKFKNDINKIYVKIYKIIKNNYQRGGNASSSLSPLSPLPLTSFNLPPPPPLQSSLILQKNKKNKKNNQTNQNIKNQQNKKNHNNKDNHNNIGKFHDFYESIEMMYFELNDCNITFDRTS